MKKKVSIGIILLGIIGVIIGVVRKTNECRQIAVIGGADGPTSIYLAGKVNGDNIWIIISVLIILVGIIVLIIRKKK